MSASLRASKLTRLPVEILEHVASYLYRPSQLNNLSRTCKQLNFVMQPRLYREFAIVLPRYWSSLMFLETLLESSAEGLQFTKSITISMQNDKLGVPSESYEHEDDGLDFDQDDDWGDQEDDLGQKHYQPRVLNTLLRLLISKVPTGCLQTFRWCHTTRISKKTLELVARRHGHCLTTLQIYNISSGTFKTDFSALTTFDAGDMDPYFALFWASKSVANSHKSLTHLKVGCEKLLALSYLGRLNPLSSSDVSGFTWHLDEDIRDSLPVCSQKLSKSEEESSLPTSILTVESLHLVGIDCGFTPEIGAPTMLDIHKLTSLCLESCFNLGQNFPVLSPPRSPDAPPLLPQLRSFRLRQEGSDASFQDGLKAFLLATKGLVHLAVLLEGSGPFLSPDCFVCNHGSTLQTLVWDQRQGPRKKLDESTNTATPFMIARPLHKIASECPNLRELGLAVNILTNETDDEDPDFHPYYVSHLKNLKTLNIRILPTQKVDSKISSFPKVHAIIAMDVANALLSYGLRLETLGLGSTTWTDIWQGRSREFDSDPCETYLCPRIYHVDYPINLRGQRQPMVTQIAQGTATEAKEYSSNLRIFEPYWLA